MFERINKKVKGFFSSQRMKTLALHGSSPATKGLPVMEEHWG